MALTCLSLQHLVFLTNYLEEVLDCVTMAPTVVDQRRMNLQEWLVESVALTMVGQRRMKFPELLVPTEE